MCRVLRKVIAIIQDEIRASSLYNTQTSNQHLRKNCECCINVV